MIELIVALAIVLVIAAVLLPAVQAVRQSAHLTHCKYRMHQAGLAIHEQITITGRFPKSTHKPWTQVVLPGLIIHPLEDQELKPDITVLRCPADSLESIEDKSLINFVFNFDVDGLRPEAISDGCSMTALLSEVPLEFGAMWHDPPMVMAGALGSKHFDRVNVNFCDGSVRELSAHVSAEVIGHLLTPCGGEVLELE
jgi:prepilin-type processing-associated H-X9-DG protein